MYGVVRAVNCEAAATFSDLINSCNSVIFSFFVMSLSFLFISPPCARATGHAGQVARGIALKRQI